MSAKGGFVVVYPERLQFWKVKAQDCLLLLKAASDSAPVRMLYRDDYGDADSGRPGELDTSSAGVARGGLGQVTIRMD